MTTPTKNKPVRTLRDGLLKASIWRNQSEKGAYYTVTFSRSFKDNRGEFRDSSSFSGAELLRLSKLADLAHTEIAAIREVLAVEPIERLDAALGVAA